MCGLCCVCNETGGVCNLKYVNPWRAWLNLTSVVSEMDGLYVCICLRYCACVCRVCHVMYSMKRSGSKAQMSDSSWTNGRMDERVLCIYDVCCDVIIFGWTVSEATHNIRLYSTVLYSNACVDTCPVSIWCILYARVCVCAGTMTSFVVYANKSKGHRAVPEGPIDCTEPSVGRMGL